MMSQASHPLRSSGNRGEEAAIKIAEVLDQAWQIIWKHKILWVFGIFAGCARGGGGGVGSGSGWRQSSPFDSGTAAGINRFFSGIGGWIGEHLWVVGLFILLAVALAALAVFLGTLGRIGLIRGTVEADQGAERLAFNALFRGGLPYFWRVFGLTFLIGLAFFIIFLPLVLFGVITAGIGFLCILPLLCLLALVAWAVGILVRLADASMVVENLNLVQGMGRAWEVASKNVGPVLMIWLITALFGLIVGFVIALPVLLIVIPAAVGYFTSGQGISSAFLVAGGICLTIYLPVLIIASGVLTAYIESVWTLTFLRLTRLPQGMEGLTTSPVDA
jgi:hypothetical protein